MRKKFTMLLASLFLGLGTLWAQPEVGKEYRIKEADQNLYLTIQGYNGAGSNNARGSVPLLEKALINADQVWTLEATGTENVYNLKSKSGYYIVQGGWNVDAYDNNANQAKVQFVSNGETYKIKNMHNGNQWWKSQNVGGTWYPFCDAGEGAAAKWTLEEVPADEFAAEVTLTITYNFNGNKVSESTVEKTPGAEYTIPTLDYTKIASCKIGEVEQTVTDGACTITVPNAATTVTVELASNFPFEVSADYENATWYVLQIRSNNKKYVVRSESAPYANTTTTPTTEDALWAFVGNPFDGIQVLNKAAGTGKTLALDANNNAVMTEGATTWNITKGNGGFLLRNGNEGVNYLHDFNSTLKIWADNGAATDPGSAFVVTSEAEMISLATTAMGLASKLDTYVEASYYTYPNAAVAEAKATLQDVTTPTDFLTALQAKATVESVLAALNTAGKSGAPAAGDIIMLKNKNVNKYLIDNGEKARIETANKENKALWEIVAGETGVKLKNYATGRYLGSMLQSQATATVEAETEAGEYTWANPQDVYAAFNFVGSNQYGHESWSNLVGWWDKDANASQWVVTNVRPLSITYLYNGEELGASTEYVEYGTVYTVSSSYDFTKVSACTKNEEALEAVDGVFSFEVTEATTLIVELADDLPFEYAATVDDIETWYYMQMHSNNWHYIKRAESGLTWADTEVAEDEKNSYAWAFVGDLINGFKVVNKAAGVESALLSTGNNGETVTLTTFADATLLFVKPTSQNVEDGFCLKPATGNYINATAGTVKHWDDNDAGSTIKVTKVMPKHDLTITYMFKNAQLGEQSTARVDEGSTYTVTNPYANTNKFVTAACTANGARIDEVDGQWSVPVTGTTNVIVTITEDLPFKTSKDFATANWQYLQINSASWKYVRNFVADGDENTYSNTTDVAALNEGAQWAFVGDALNGFKILNKAAGEGYALSFDGEMGNGTAAYMKQEEKTWIIEKGNGGFVIRQGATECLNDFGGKLKVWKDDASPSGTGSAFRTISGGVKDLGDLYNTKIYVLQAERSPLLYDASAANPSKLSSGMASGIVANANDTNQQFMIVSSDSVGMYYLYSVGAGKFVDADLNFTDYPEPVLSFEANEGNPIFPWFVKIGGKYVVPGDGGTDGNKIHHTETPEADAGKWYRIEEVDEDMSLALSVALTIQSAEGLIKEASQLSNSKVYAVYTFDRGAWYHNGDDALWSTGKTAKPGDAAENADHFAFLTVNGKIYLYSVGADKFIVKSEAQHGGMYYAAYSDTPAQTVELLAATNGGWFPVVVKLNAPSAPSQLAISNSYAYPVVMYDDLSDTGNQVRIEEIGTLDLSAVVAQIEAYQMDEEAKGGLQTLITEATTKNAYLENASLTDAITAAQAALDKVGATYDELMTAKENLAAALNSALYVTEIDGFSNNYVYTFVSKRGWMGALAAEENTNVISTAKNTVDPEASDANTLFQWAVYTSESGKQYLYNIGKQMFMGVQSTNNASVPFAATPQGQFLTFKKSDWADYPIMFSTDNAGVVNHTTSYGEGLVTWTGGWNVKNDEGSNHKVTIVGKIESSTLTTIAAAVELYETQGVAVQALDAAIAAAQAKVDGIGAGLGYYSTTEAEAAATLAAIVDFKNAITGETTVAAIEDQTAAANALVETFSVNLPEAGKFYRFSYDYGTAGVKYVQAVASNVSGKANAMVMTEEQGAASIFYFADGKLLSYSAGQYVKESGNTRGLQAVGAEAGAARFEAGSVAGKLYIFAGDSFHANKSGEICFIDHCGAGHPDKGAGDEHNFIVEEVDELPLTIGSAGYSTFYTSVAVEIPDGVTAYVITAAENGMVVLSEVTDDVVPDSTGLILEGNGEYNFTIATEDAPAEFNKGLLKGTAAKTLITAEANTNYYVLAKPAGAEEAGLYKAALNKDANGNKVTEGGVAFHNGANKAYLPVVVEVAAEAPAMFSFGRGEGTTSIENAELAIDNAELVIYDLTGRRVEKMVKGIYIVNGKKVLVK